MRQVTQHFQPPLYWQQFEDLTEAVLPKVYGAATADKIGRPGQAQNGVDVHLKRSAVGSVGVQCKRMDELDDNNQPLPGGAVSRALLEEEIEKAKGFKPPLDLWILATTAKRDRRIQEVARELDEENRKAGRFEIKLWFWNDYVAFLNSYSDVQRGYYADVIGLRDAREQDVLILDLISTAFHRPALTDPLNVESPDDMLQALRDTQAALRLGRLVDRQSRAVIRTALGGWRSIDNPNWRTELKVLDGVLGRARVLMVAALRDGRLKRNGQFLDVIDLTVGREIEDARASCISILNGVLVDANLSPI